MNTRNRWTADDIPDQEGRVVVVTGSSSGIGKEAARMLARKNAAVVIAVRNVEKGRAVADGAHPHTFMARHTRRNAALPGTAHRLWSPLSGSVGCQRSA